VYTFSVKKRGRPLKLPEQKRDERLDLRVSAAEKAAFKLAAANSDAELSVWIRIQLHQAAAQELKKAGVALESKEK